MVRADIDMLTPLSIRKTEDELLPLIAREAEGPLIVRSWGTSISPDVSVIREQEGDRAKTIVSPEVEPATDALREPAPESLQFVTMIVLAPATWESITIPNVASPTITVRAIHQRRTECNIAAPRHTHPVKDTRYRRSEDVATRCHETAMSQCKCQRVEL
jgi:hypothetical protein